MPLAAREALPPVCVFRALHMGNKNKTAGSSEVRGSLSVHAKTEVAFTCLQSLIEIIADVVVLGKWEKRVSRSDCNFVEFLSFFLFLSPKKIEWR